MAQSLLAIATFVALIGGVIFGVKKFEKQSQSEENTEFVAASSKLIELPTLSDPPLPSVEELMGEEIEPPTLSDSSLSSGEEPTGAEIEGTTTDETDTDTDTDNTVNSDAPFQASTIDDPWNDSEATTAEPNTAHDITPSVLELGDIAEPEAPIEPTEDLNLAETTSEATSSATPEVTPTPVEEETPIAQTEAIEPRQEPAEVILPATIHDPKRPNSEASENLTQEILAWGQSQDLKYIPKLVAYTTHPDSIIRANVASALGQIAAHQPTRGEVERLIPILGKLSQDSNIQVKQFAVQALGSIRSQKVLPYLQQALLSPSGSVMKAAHDALQNLKLHYGQTPAMQIAQQKLEKITPKARKN